RNSFTPRQSIRHPRGAATRYFHPRAETRDERRRAACVDRTIAEGRPVSDGATTHYDRRCSRRICRRLRPGAPVEYDSSRGAAFRRRYGKRTTAHPGGIPSSADAVEAGCPIAVLNIAMGRTEIRQFAVGTCHLAIPGLVG